MSIVQIISNNIKNIRTEKGYSQEELADLAGLHRTYIGSVERGERNITVLNLEKIAKALGVMPVVLLAKDAKSAKRKRT